MEHRVAGPRRCVKWARSQTAVLRDRTPSL